MNAARWIGRVTILCCLLGSALAPAQAQDAEAAHGGRVKPQHELGVNLLGLVSFPQNQRFNDPMGTAQYSVANGLLYKVRCHRTALRFGVDVFRSAYERQLPGTEYWPAYDVSGKETRAELRVGFEYRPMAGSLQPFAALDLVGRRDWTSAQGERVGFGASPAPERYDHRTASTSYRYAFSLGLAHRISDRFSCSVESSVSSRLDVWNSDSGSWQFDPLRTVAVHYRLR